MKRKYYSDVDMKRQENARELWPKLKIINVIRGTTTFLLLNYTISSNIMSSSVSSGSFKLLRRQLRSTRLNTRCFSQTSRCLQQPPRTPPEPPKQQPNRMVDFGFEQVAESLKASKGTKKKTL